MWCVSWWIWIHNEEMIFLKNSDMLHGHCVSEAEGCNYLITVPFLSASREAELDWTALSLTPWKQTMWPHTFLQDLSLCFIPINHLFSFVLYFFAADTATHISRCLLRPPHHTRHTPLQLRIPFATKNWTVGSTFTHRPLLIHCNEQFYDSFRARACKACHLNEQSCCVRLVAILVRPSAGEKTIIIPWLETDFFFFNATSLNTKYFLVFRKLLVCFNSQTFCDVSAIQ